MGMEAQKAESRVEDWAGVVAQVTGVGNMEEVMGLAMVALAAGEDWEDSSTAAVALFHAAPAHPPSHPR